MIKFRFTSNVIGKCTAKMLNAEQCHENCKQLESHQLKVCGNPRCFAFGACWLEYSYPTATAHKYCQGRARKLIKYRQKRTKEKQKLYIASSLEKEQGRLF